MMKNKKTLVPEEMPEFQTALDGLPSESKLFVDLSMNIAHVVHLLMEAKGMKQKDLAEGMGKSEAEISKILGGMQNLTLRTIAKLEVALGEQIVQVPITEKDLEDKQRPVIKSISSKLANTTSNPMQYSNECPVRNMFDKNENVNGNDPKVKVC